MDVVSAVMIRGGRVFLTQRRPDQSFPMHWESMGGKVEDSDREGRTPQEGLRAALNRELFEELEFWFETPQDSLSVEVAVAAEPFFVAEFRAGQFEGHPDAVRIFFFCVEVAEGCWPVGAEGQGSGWFSIPEMRALRMLPGNEEACGMVEREVVRASAKEWHGGPKVR